MTSAYKTSSSIEIRKTQKAHRTTPLTRGVGRLRKPDGFYLVCLSEISRREGRNVVFLSPRPRWKPATPLSGEAAGSFGSLYVVLFFVESPGIELATS